MPKITQNAPSVSEPESVARTNSNEYGFTSSVGVAFLHIRFPEPQPIAVLLPERFRGGCSFGAGETGAGLSHNGVTRCSSIAEIIAEAHDTVNMS
jgi:hypothetical protein